MFNYWVLIVLACISSISTSIAQAQGPIPTRTELAELLYAAEQSRSWFRIQFIKTYEYASENTPAGAYSTTLLGLADGAGRFRLTRSNSSKVEYQASGSHETTTWDRSEIRVLGEPVNNDIAALPYISITEEFPIYLLTHHELFPLLGLTIDFPTSERTPTTRVSEVLEDMRIPAEISRVNKNGKDLIEVVIPEPFWPTEAGPHFVFYYDPSKDWLLTGYVKSSSGPDSDDFDQRYHNEMRVIESEEIDGVWMPTLVKDHQIFYSDPDPVDQIATIRLSDIELEPTVTDEDFTIDISSLPEGASVVDSRLGISYKIGDTMIYMDGHLNDVGEPIRSEITPSELVRLMKDAIPQIDPVATEKLSQLEDVTSNGIISRYSTWGFAFIGLGLASFGFLLWRRNHA